MKKVKLLSLFLALLMLGGCCVLLSSCGERVGVAKLSGKEVTVDLSGYSVVFASSFFDTKTMVDQVTGFTKKLSDATGVGIIAAADSKTKSTAADPEILIGLTDRTQSTKVQNSIKGDGFAIQVLDNKIVITGSSNLHVLQAMNFFVEQFVKEDTKKSLVLDKKVTANRLDSVLLADSNACTTTFVYENGLTVDKAPGSIYTHGGRDCATTQLDDILQALSSATGLKRSAKNYPLRPDSEAADGTEFMVGKTDREVYRACLAELEGDQYGIFVRDGQFVLAAHNDLALSKGENLLADLIKDAAVKKDGVTAVVFPEGFKVTGIADEAIVTDFQKPTGEGIELHSTFYAGNDSLQYYYTGSGVNADSYKAYRDALVAEGYTVISENSIEGSQFVTLEGKALGHTLYVAYNAFSHKSEYEKTKEDARYAACIRVVSAPLSSVTLPDAGLLTPNPSYHKKTESAITTMEILSTAAGMCYIVTLEDGRFIVFDSGGVNEAGDEHDQLYELLAKRNQQVTGSETSASNPIHIAAWVITHSHWDHYAALNSMISKYGLSGKIRMDYMIGNFPAETSMWKVSEGGIKLFENDATIKGLQSQLKGGFQFIKVHTGQKLYLANVEIEVLATFDDLHPHRIENQNDTNTVLRFTMRSTNGKGQTVGEPTTVLWLGDSYKYQSRYLCAMYGSYLKSDMVQMAHHGNIGCEKDLYGTVQAKVLWFPIFVKHFNLFMTPQWTASYEVNLYAVTLPSTQYIYVSGKYDITLPFSATTGMPDYDNIFDTMTGNKIEYDNEAAYNSTEKFK